MMAIVEWFLTQTVWGVFVLAAILYGLARTLKAVVQTAPDPIFVAMVPLRAADCDGP